MVDDDVRSKQKKKKDIGPTSFYLRTCPVVRASISRST